MPSWNTAFRFPRSLCGLVSTHSPLALAKRLAKRFWTAIRGLDFLRLEKRRSKRQHELVAPFSELGFAGNTMGHEHIFRRC